VADYRGGNPSGYGLTKFFIRVGGGGPAVGGNPISQQA
jgi:hypothetical protein